MFGIYFRVGEVWVGSVNVQRDLFFRVITDEHDPLSFESQTGTID